MSKGLSSYPEHQREAVARRRSKGEPGGNGWSAAMAYLRIHNIKVELAKRKKTTA